MQLSDKETKFLKDQLHHEEICIQKYNDYAGKAADPKLKQLFEQHSQHEGQHRDTINSFLQGQGGQVGQVSGAGQSSMSASSSGSQSSGQSGSQSGGQSGSQSGSKWYGASQGQGSQGQGFSTQAQCQNQSQAQSHTQSQNQSQNQSKSFAQSAAHMSSGTMSTTQISGSQAGNSSQGTQSGSQSQGSQAVQPKTQGANCDGHDEFMCNDMLMTEKYVSGAYDTAIFEAANPQLRQGLQHIQKEEQKHGEDIFNYMAENGMYKVK